MLKILVIDDELPIRRFLRSSLPSDQYQVLEASTGREGIQAIATHNPDLVLLDLGLPDMDGVQATKEVREWSKIPILILSARDLESDKILALDSGADDYLTKPFGIGELLARIRVALRKTSQQEFEKTVPRFTSDGLEVDFAKREVISHGKQVHLTPIEFKLLSVLIRYSGKVVTHNQLLKEVWGEAFSRQNQYLRVFMGQLRHKIEKDPTKPQYLLTEPGVGYRFRWNEA